LSVWVLFINGLVHDPLRNLDNICVALNGRMIEKVKISRDRPRWPKGYRVDQGPGFLDISALRGW